MSVQTSFDPAQFPAGFRDDNEYFVEAMREMNERRRARELPLESDFRELTKEEKREVLRRAQELKTEARR